MIITTHPANAHLLSKYVSSYEPFYFGQPKIIYSEYLAINKIVGYKPKNERFIEYGVCDWTIYFGFVEPIYKPLIYVFHEKKIHHVGFDGIPQLISARITSPKNTT